MFGGNFNVNNNPSKNLLINTALAGDTEKSQYKAPADISADILSQYETGIYYSGVPSVIQNPNWDGTTLEEKFVPAQAAYPGLSLIPSYEGDLYLSGPNFNPVNIGNMQELLEDAGYLTGAYNPGSNDAATKAAVRAWFNDVNGASTSSCRCKYSSNDCKSASCTWGKLACASNACSYVSCSTGLFE